RIMTNGHISFFVLIAVTYVISLFFWPTPAVPLVGAILIPVAIRSGLPPVGTAVAIAIAVQGMALSSDYVIQIAPTISASASNFDVWIVAYFAVVLSIITGVIAIILAYFFLRKSIQTPAKRHLDIWNQEDGEEYSEVKEEEKVGKKRQAHLFAIIV